MLNTMQRRKDVSSVFRETSVAAHQCVKFYQATIILLRARLCITGNIFKIVASFLESRYKYQNPLYHTLYRSQLSC